MPVPLATPFGRLAHERGSVRGVILSAAVHAALVVLALWSGSRLVEADRMPGAGPGKGGGGGGGGARALLLFAPPAPPASGPTVPLPKPLEVPTATPVPIPVVQPPDVSLPPPQISDAQLLASLDQGAGRSAGSGPGSGGGSGGGSGTGRGPGMGPDSGGGGGSIYPPVLEGFIMPPFDRPAEVRGTTVKIRFEVSERGAVMRVFIDPMPRDRKFASEFLQRLRQYHFRPARTLDGRPVAAVTTATVTL